MGTVPVRLRRSTVHLDAEHDYRLTTGDLQERDIFSTARSAVFSEQLTV